ncbi:GNAT family N-acetyltransferase [Nonomuraea sp. PA05]|uniref:GNAT family N-acetyltransferase n=1 Tax=Nonomuraea sp. PA05 TaxID=2604466 RepID=UPI001CA308FF|nr:GNAT family N-acetyltransferase [Nonomuraea sp. PA05]
MAAVRLGCAERDRINARSILEGIPASAEIGQSLHDSPENQVVVERDGGVVGYVTVRWWEERDGTWVHLHRGHLLPGHRGRGVGSAMLDWAEGRIRSLVGEQDCAHSRVRRERHGRGA